jgi:hypothetical protein
MKSIFFLSLALLSGGVFSGDSSFPRESSIPGDPTFINPTGTYLLKGTVKNSKIVGHSGELRVRLLDTTTIAITFYLNKGYPDYESGSVMDTLTYADNRAVFQPSNDSSCSIYFAFKERSVEVFQAMTDPHSSCGFRPGVIVPAMFGKTSDEVPVIQDLSLHGNN